MVDQIIQGAIQTLISTGVVLGLLKYIWNGQSETIRELRMEVQKLTEVKGVTVTMKECALTREKCSVLQEKKYDKIDATLIRLFDAIDELKLLIMKQNSQ